MAGRKPLSFTYPSGAMGGRGEPPPDKKRRTDIPPASNIVSNIGDDLWDDDLNFTQAELENIDCAISSQQVHQDVTIASNSNRMVGRGTGRSFSEGNMLSSSSHDKVVDSPANIPLSSQGSIPFKNSAYMKSQADRGNIPTRPFGGKSTMQIRQRTPLPESTDSGNHFQKQSTSNRLCLPPKPGASSSSLKSPLTPLMGSTGSGEFSPALPNSAVRPPQSRTEFNDLTQQKILKLEKELAAVKKENAKAKKLSCRKDGEINMLRGVLHETKEELTWSKKEQLKMRDMHRTEQSEKEKNLLQEVEGLKTQMQFAERDRDELQTRCKLLEKRSSAAAGAGDGVCSPVVSPQRRHNRDVNSPCTPRGTPKGSFPNRVTFMAEEKSKIKSSPRTKPTAIEATARPPEIAQPSKPDWQKGVSVTIPNRRGRISGPSLVSLMLPRAGSTKASQQGIVGLLQMQRNKPDVPNATATADLDTLNLMSRKTSRWIQGLLQQSLSSQGSDPADAPSVLVPQHYHSLAVQAISSLLQAEPCLSQVPTSALLQDHTDKAVFLLPVIESYLCHYLQTSNSLIISSAGSSFAGSIDSYDSVMSHQTSQARESAVYTRQVEQRALNALHVLRVLVDFSPQVRLALFSDAPQDQARGQQRSSVEASSEESVSSNISPVASNISAARVARTCHILDELMRIANPDKIGSTDMIEMSLQILCRIASNVPTDALMRFESFLGQQVLQMCLIWELTGPMEQRLRCHLHVLELVKTLVRSEDMLPKLCTASEDCLLLVLYAALPSSSEYRTRFGLKLIEMLTASISHHRLGMTAVLESDCQCRSEVVKTVTQLLYHGLDNYRAAPTAIGLQLLHQGAVLLSTLAQCSRLFVQLRREIENQYIEVVIGLHVIFKDLSDTREYDEIIQTLWDFDVEYSQSPDYSDDAMDIT